MNIEQFPQQNNHPKPEKHSSFKEKARKLVKSVTAGAMLGAGVFGAENSKAQIIENKDTININTKMDIQQIPHPSAEEIYNKRINKLDTIITHDIDDPRLKEFNDSMAIFKEEIDLDNEITDIMTNDKAEYKDGRKIVIEKIKQFYERYPDVIFPKIEGQAFYYYDENNKKVMYYLPRIIPVQPIIYEEISKKPVYGPAQGLIGFYTKEGKFEPVRDRENLSSPFHEPDRKILEKYEKGETDQELENRLKSEYGY